MWVGHSCPTPLTLVLPLWVGPNSASTSKASDRACPERSRRECPTHTHSTHTIRNRHNRDVHSSQTIRARQVQNSKALDKAALSEVEGNVRGTPAELHTSCQTSQAKPCHSSTYITSAYLLLQCT